MISTLSRPMTVQLAPVSPLSATAKANAMTVFGSVEGSIRPLSAAETDDLQFLSHDKILTWEGLIEDIGTPNARVHLIDTKRFAGHYGYTKNALSRGTAYTQTNFFAEVQSPENRRYMPFLVFDFRDRPLVWQGKSYQWVINIRRYNYTDTHSQLAAMLVELKTLLGNHLFSGAGEPLLFVYEKTGSFRRPHVNHLADVHAAGFEVITERAMIESAGGTLVSVLNPGTAIGYLKRIAVGASSEELTPRHIAIFEDTPERIPPVTGIVTLEPQTPLSHVNLLAKNRGTPNVSTANISLIPNLNSLTGSLVKMIAGRNGTVTIQSATLAEAEQFWAERTQSELEVPAISATSFQPAEFATVSDDEAALSKIGAKASSYAAMQTLLGSDVIKPGFALSFAHYQKIARVPATQLRIQDLLAQKGSLAPEEINDRLEAIRNSIRKETPKEILDESVSAVRSVISQLNVPRIRLRSSTNSEDLPTFNGAGLYESTGFNVDDSDKKLRKKLLKVMASLWLDRAFWERELFGIDHSKVGMAILINPAFSDEYGNGVVIGSQEDIGFRTWVNAQKGEASVTNPLDNEIPESFTFVGRSVDRPQVQSHSNLGNVFLDDETSEVHPTLLPQLLQLQNISNRLYDHFVARQRDLDDRRKYGIDIEYKLMSEGDQVVLYVKQSRLLNLEHEAVKPNDSIRKAIAKDNGMDGAHLRRQPRQLSALSASEFCVVKTDSAIGINSFESVGNGFVKVNVTIPSSSCPLFTGQLYLFRKHFNWI